MNGQLIACQDLTLTHRHAMRRLLETHFAGVSEAVFEADLAEKNWIILLEDEAGTLVGFSTLLLYRTEHDNEPITVVYSGDTIVTPSAWGSSALARTWIHAVWQLHAACGVGRLFWLLITSGYRTYRFLPVFWQCFHPRHDAPMPASIRILRDRLCANVSDSSMMPLPALCALSSHNNYAVC